MRILSIKNNCYFCRMKFGAPYNKDEIAYIKCNYKDMSNKELGAMLNRSPASIRKKRHKLRFNRTPAELKRIFQRNSNLFVKGEGNYYPPKIDPYNVPPYIFQK